MQKVNSGRGIQFKLPSFPFVSFPPKLFLYFSFLLKREHNIKALLLLFSYGCSNLESFLKEMSKVPTGLCEKFFIQYQHEILNVLVEFTASSVSSGKLYLINQVLWFLGKSLNNHFRDIKKKIQVKCYLCLQSDFSHIIWLESCLSPLHFLARFNLLLPSQSILFPIWLKLIIFLAKPKCT